LVNNGKTWKQFPFELCKSELVVQWYLKPLTSFK
jgi:hypothetical protein